MGEDSKIQWTHHTFNGWAGCTKVDEKCRFCYAEVNTVARVQRAQGVELWGAGGTRLKMSPKYWLQPFAWDRAARKAGERRRVFAHSLSDVFEDRPELEAWRDELHATIALTPNLDWLLLTKRPANAVRYYADRDLYSRVLEAAGPIRDAVKGLSSIGISDPVSFAGRANRWLGYSGEDVAGIEHLLAAPAAVRFLSIEPLLGPVYLNRAQLSQLDWVIVGGESGPNARRTSINDLQGVVDQCRALGCPVFVKQLGAYPELHPGPISWPSTDPKGGDMAEWPPALRVRRFPEQAALMARRSAKEA